MSKLVVSLEKPLKLSNESASALPCTGVYLTNRELERHTLNDFILNPGPGQTWQTFSVVLELCE